MHFFQVLHKGEYQFTNQITYWRNLQKNVSQKKQGSVLIYRDYKNTYVSRKVRIISNFHIHYAVAFIWIDKVCIMDVTFLVFYFDDKWKLVLCFEKNPA